jgi:hypothetical protein
LELVQPSLEQLLLLIEWAVLECEQFEGIAGVMEFICASVAMFEPGEGQARFSQLLLLLQPLLQLLGPALLQAVASGNQGQLSSSSSSSSSREDVLYAAYARAVFHLLFIGEVIILTDPGKTDMSCWSIMLPAVSATANIAASRNAAT